MKKAKIMLSWILLLTLTFIQNIYSQNDSLNQGIKESQKGNFEQAEKILSEINSLDIDQQIKINIARGYNFSWWKKYDKAILMFKKAIDKNPQNTDANLGLAYTYLWNRTPKKAKEQFKKVLTLDSKNQEATKQLELLKNTNEKFEIDAWYGFVFLEKKDQNGFRRLNFKYFPNNKNLLFVYYDNALILENANLSTTERNAPIMAFGSKHDWSKKWFTKIEGGKRFLTNFDDQYMVNMENGYFFSSKLLGKLFVQYDSRQDDELVTIAGFLDYEVIENIRMELGFFHSENLTFKNTFNERLILSSKAQIKKIELLAGIYYDKFNTPTTTLSQIGGAFGLVSLPIAKGLRTKFFLNHDKGFNNKITILSIGINQKF